MVGILKAHRTPTNRRYSTCEDYLQVRGLPPKRRLMASCFCVARAGQKGDLERQRQTVGQYCIASGLYAELRLKNVGSGLNYERRHCVEQMEPVENGEINETSLHTRTVSCALASRRFVERTARSET